MVAFGWIPDLPDQRDYRFARIAPPPRALPERVDLRPFCSPIEDQGNLGSCTAQALVGALEYLARKDGLRGIDLSRLFLYYNERAMEGTVSWDSGAYIRDGAKSLSHDGVCPESLWKYRTWLYRKKPCARAYASALFRQVTSYWRISGLYEMRLCLADGFPFVFGFTVYESFMSDGVARTGTVPMPSSSEQVLGGHAVLAVGYDDVSRRFLCRNSWGTGWGDAGYFTMPYEYVGDDNLADDFWTLRAGERA